MKTRSNISILSISFFISFLLSTNNSFSQTTINENLTKEKISSLIHKISDSLIYYYVDSNDGKAIGEILKKNLKKGNYSNIKNPKILAKKLTTDLRSLNGDKHLYVSFKSQNKEKIQSSKTLIKDYYGKGTNYGFQTLKFYKNNIGYLKIDHFSNWDYANQARQKATEVIQLLGNSNALIIDVRDNSGGVPYLASYLVSYFFEDNTVHLADFYSRFNDSNYAIYTEPLVPGYKFPDLPIFVIVNNKSASSAEELAFWLQNHKRATIIGEPTAGAGYGAMTHKLNDEFSISISSEIEIDPITKKGFQSTGVIPDILLSSNKLIEKTIELANTAIIENQVLLNESKKNRLEKLNLQLDDKNSFISEEEIFNKVLVLHMQGMLNYNDIKVMGNKYINEPKKAIPILKVNTVLYPFYPHPFDDYAKALLSDNRFEQALINYNKAVNLAELKNNGDLIKFKDNRTVCEKLLKKYLTND